jgi:hypothetical protein
MQMVMALPGIEEKWDSKEVEDLILAQLDSHTNNNTPHKQA